MTETMITTQEQLDALYGPAKPRSLVKEAARIVPVYRPFIEASSFVVLATIGVNGVDVSPRGDAPGFVRMHDDKTLMIPDRPGNKRIDSLRNIVTDPRVSMLFLVPGVGETLRVRGHATITTDPDLCVSFAVKGKPAISVICVAVAKVYYQCQKALARSGLWNADAQVDRSTLPSAGDMNTFFDQDFDGAAYDADYPEYMKQTMY